MTCRQRRAGASSNWVDKLSQDVEPLVSRGCRSGFARGAGDQREPEDGVQAQKQVETTIVADANPRGAARFPPGFALVSVAQCGMGME